MAIDPNVITILEKTSSPDKAELEVAQKYLEDAARTNLPELLKVLSDILASEQCTITARMQAGLQLKNAVYSKDESVRQSYQTRWMQIPDEIRNYIKNNCLLALGTEKSGHSSAAQCVAYIACIELSNNQWGDVIKKLVDFVVNPASGDRLRLSTLEAIGYICQDIDASILASQSNDILTAIVYGMKDVEQEDVKIAANCALLNSLEFTKNNFKSDHERNYLMQVVCESTQSPNSQISVAAMQCLAKIMSLYYEYMEQYMSAALFPITVNAMKSPIPEMALQGIEFWSTVCDEEIDLAVETSECAEKGQPPSVCSKFYAKGALTFVTPILMEVIAQQTETADEDDWNPSKAASVCLMLLAQLSEDDIVPLVLPFVNENINSDDWRRRDAAAMSFGSILEGPDTNTLKPFVQSAMIVIIKMMTDESAAVRDTAAWTIGRVCEVLPELALKEEYLLSLLQGLINGLVAEPRVASNVCWALSNLAESAYEEATKNLPASETEPKTYALSSFYTTITEALIHTCVRGDGSQNNLRNAAYSALMDLMRCSAKDCYNEVRQVTFIILERLGSVLGAEEQVSAQDKAEYMDLQSLLCGTLQSVLRKISREDALQISDNVMLALIKMLSCPLESTEESNASGVHEDALLTVSSLIEVLNNDFLKYMDSFMPRLIECLQCSKETNVCCNAVGVVGDMCRNLNQHMQPHSDHLFKILINILQDSTVDTSLRPAVINVFSDFALALNKDLEKYLPIMMEILEKATQANVDTSDPDMVDYIQSLRNSCLEAYTGILHGLKEKPQDSSSFLEVFFNYSTYILCFMYHIFQDPTVNDEIIANSCALIGDLLSTYGASLLMQNQEEQIASILNKGKKSKSTKTKQLALWALKEVKKLKSADGNQIITTNGTSPAVGINHM